MKTQKKEMSEMLKKIALRLKHDEEIKGDWIDQEYEKIKADWINYTYLKIKFNIK